MRLARYYNRPAATNSSVFDQFTNLRDEINRLFDLPANGFGSEFFHGWNPALDLYEDKDNFVVRVELPGLKKEDVDVSLHNGSVVVSGERKAETNVEGKVSRAERFFGRFQRAVALPKPVTASKVTASYQDGILTVTLPKTEEAKPRQIEIN